MARQMIVGKEALTVIRHRDGTRSNVARGRAVPASAEPTDVQRLLDEGFLEVIELLEPVTDEAAEVEDDFPGERFPDLVRPADWDQMTEGQKFAYVYGGAPDPSAEPAEPDAVEAEAEEEESDAVTDEEITELLKGSAAEVMAEVGDNPTLAQRVLDAETEGGTVEGRKGLTADLRGVIEDGSE